MCWRGFGDDGAGGGGGGIGDGDGGGGAEIKQTLENLGHLTDVNNY